MGVGLCLTCHYPYDDSGGPGFVKRHQATPEHVEALRKGQAKAAEALAKRDAHGYVPWTLIEVDEEEEERMSLRRALEQAQREEAQ